MTWNYRVVKQIHDTHGGEETLFQIHEVYYDKKGEVVRMTEDAIPLDSETVEGLCDVLVEIQKAFAKSVLEHDARGNPFIH